MPVTGLGPQCSEPDCTSPARHGGRCTDCARLAAAFPDAAALWAIELNRDRLADLEADGPERRARLDRVRRR